MEMTIADFCDHIGIEPLHDALRAIDKHNLEHVWLVLMDGTRLYYHSKGLNDYDPQTTVKAVGAGCIAWDGSDWEAGFESPFTSGSVIDDVRALCLDAYEEYITFHREDEEPEWDIDPSPAVEAVELALDNRPE